MDYSRTYRKGDNMASVDKQKRKEKNSIENNIKVYEKYTCFAVGFIIIILIVAVLKNSIFIPALLITIGLELFTISYYFMDNKDKKGLVYNLFVLGIILVIIAIVYTILKIM